MTLIETALDLKKNLDEFRPIGHEIEARIMQKFRLDWNYHSNHTEGREFDHQSSILFEFGLFNFTVRTWDSKVIFVRKYGENLTDEEIEKLMKYEATRHKNIIENKVKELS